MPEEIKVLILRKRNGILDKVRDNPLKVNFYDSTRDNFLEVKSVSEVSEELSITTRAIDR